MNFDFFSNKLIRRMGLGVGIGIILIGYIYIFQIRPPRSFPSNTVFSIGNGKSLSEIASDLKAKNIIRSPFWFTNFVILLKHERTIVSGQYSFERPLNVYQIAERLALGQFNTSQIRTMIPEGSDSGDISLILKKNYPEFDTEKFLALARKKEGYLFPDTYYFGATIQPEQVINVMTSTFERKIQQKEVKDAIAVFGKPLSDIVAMASMLEGEARQMKTRQTIAGILWERMRIGMPLQVDVTFRYINGKATSDLTLADLRIDSPYNTYVYRGLPPPVSNPGIGSIMAAVTPVKTNYLYFLSDKSGVMHYARTLEEHKINREKYLP